MFMLVSLGLLATVRLFGLSASIMLLSRASDDSPVVRPLCVVSAARGGPFEVDGLGKSAHATACGSERNLGLLQIIESHSRHNSSWGVDVVACARDFALPAASASASSSAFSPASLAVVAHARSSPMHYAHNSWSDTGRVQGLTGTGRCTKGGVSGPSEDLRPVSEVEAGVNFRPPRGVRGQVAGFTSQEATRHRYQASVKGRCGHTSPPPGGAWYPIRVTWIRIGTSGNQWAGRRCVEPHMIGDLGAEG